MGLTEGGDLDVPMDSKEGRGRKESQEGLEKP